MCADFNWGYPPTLFFHEVRQDVQGSDKQNTSRWCAEERREASRTEHDIPVHKGPIQWCPGAGLWSMSASLLHARKRGLIWKHSQGNNVL